MNSARDYELYKNIIPMVHSINVRICAEGIEEREWLLKMKAMKVDYLQDIILEDHVERNSFCNNMPEASTLNKESKADSAMWGCLILWSYQKDEFLTACLSLSRSSASG